MYFDLLPKTKKEDLYGVEYLLNDLINNLNDDKVRLVVIKGLRRTGKTSLLNVSLKESKEEFVKIDVRETPFFSYNEFINYFIETVNSSMDKGIIKKLLDKLKDLGLTLEYGKIKANLKLNLDRKQELNKYLKSLNQILKKNKKQLIIAIDEVHLLKSIKVDYLFASIYDNYENIKLVFTGSEIGLLEDFLGASNYDAPLYGRLFETIQTKKLHPEESVNFLREGFKQVGKEISLDNLSDVIERLDGIIGWATQYGFQRIKGNSHINSLNKVVEYGTELTKREFNNFLNTRQSKERYIKVMKFLSKGISSWSEIKYAFIKENLNISDRQLALYLNNLVGHGFIEEKNKSYYIIDPLLIKVF
jgi:uncharacterized protein